MVNQQFKNLLQKNRSSITPERTELFRILQSYGKPYDVSSLIEHTATTMNKTTVYRNLDLFEKLGIAHRVYTGWKYKVELTDKFRDHHHHISCTNCDDLVAFNESALFERELKRIGQKYGFTEMSHSLELKGLCAACRTKHIA